MTLNKVNVVSHTKLTKPQLADLQHVMALAKKDPFLETPDDEVIREGDDRAAILLNAQVVGFFSPSKTSFLGVRHHRAGALYLLPEYRGKGIMREALSAYFATKTPALSWIADNNAASQKLFKALGFVQNKAKAGQGGEAGHWYLKPKSDAALEEGKPGYCATIVKPAYFNWR